MTDYIISPWLIYLIQFSDSLRSAMIGTAVVSGILLVILAIGGFLSVAWIKDFGENRSPGAIGFLSATKKLAKPTIIAFVVSLIFTVLLPSQETLVFMLVAKTATYSNVNMTVDTIKEIVDYIIKSVQTLK